MRAESSGEASTSKAHVNLSSGLSGAMSGVVVGACLQPLDVIRTRMQGDSAKGLQTNSGLLGTIREISSTQGLGGFWRGTGPTVIRLGLGVGLHMILVENIKTILAASRQSQKDKEGQGSSPSSSSSGRLSSLEALISGAGARSVASTLLCPVTVVKTRMEYGGKDALHYKNTCDALSTIARTEGPRSLFRGLVPTIMSNAPFSGLYYMFYIRLKEALGGEGRPQVITNLSSGFISGMAATCLTQPFDVLRTRMQLSTRHDGLAASRGALSSFGGHWWSALRTTVTRQGPQALFVGTLPRVIKRTGQTALIWALYEELTPLLLGAHAHIVSKLSQ